MDGLNNTCFQSVVILGLKTALLEAQDEINRIRKERDEARKKVLQLIQANSKFQVEVINSNQLATKLKSMLKKLRNEFEEHKKEMTDKEHDNVNLGFKVKELKSLLDIKTELLESLNIKGDRVSKDEIIDYRANYKTLMRHLKLVIRNQPCYPDNQLLEDIQNVISKAERGKPTNLSKYLVKKTKSDKEEINKCNDDDEKSAEISDNYGIRISSSPLSNYFTNLNDICAEKVGLNTTQKACSTKTENPCFLDDNISPKTNIVAEKTIEICDKPVINVGIALKSPLESEERINVISSGQKDDKDMGTTSDSESDKTSGFCDVETEVESPPSMELSGHTRSTPSPKNHTSAMCMPDLVLSIHAEKSTPKVTCSSTKTVNENNTTPKIPISLNPTIVKDDNKSPKKVDLKNACKVQSILEEMKTLKNTMICQVSSLEQFHDDTSVESNNCFKRPLTMHPSHRESLRKNRNSTEDTSNFIPKRSSQLVKRDPCSRKIVDQVSGSKFDTKPDPLISERNDNKTDSVGKLNLNREVHYSACRTKAKENLKVDESFVIENSSSLCNGTSCLEDSIETNSSSLCNDTSCFEDSLETTTQSLSQLLVESQISSTVVEKDTSNETDIFQSDNEVVVEKNKSMEVCQHLIDGVKLSVDNELTNELKNSHMESLPYFEPVTNLANSGKEIGVEELKHGVTTEENSSILDEHVDNVLSENNSSRTDEKPSSILTKESVNAPKICFDSLLFENPPSSIDEKPCDVFTPEISNAYDECRDVTQSKKVISDIDEKPVPQSTDSSTLDSKETVAVSESSNESVVLENTSTEENVLEEDVPKKRKCGRTKKTLSVTEPKPSSPSSSVVSTVEPSTNSPKTTRGINARLKTAAVTCNTEAVVVNLPPLDTMNNGMERRKRKGKFNEILDSLKSKSKRRKVDFHPEKTDLTEGVKPLQRRGRKRKTSLPVETFDSYTQTNWSPRSESVVFRVTEDISELEEISTESETQSETPLLNVQNKQQIEDHTPSATSKENGYFSDAIPGVITSEDSVTESENHPPSSVFESCNFAPNSLFGQLMDMSKIIQERISTVVESQKIVAKAKVETSSSLGKEDIPDAPSVSTNQRESFPIFESEPNQLSTTSEPKLKQEHVPILSSSECKNDAEPCEKSTSKLESISVVILKQDSNFNSPNSSLKTETCKESIPKMDTTQTENRAASTNGENLKQECVSSSSYESVDDEVTSSKTEATCKAEIIPFSDLKQENLPDSANSSSEVENDEEKITSSSTDTSCEMEVIPSTDLKVELVPDSPNLSSSSESEIEQSPEKSSIPNTNQAEGAPVAKLKQNVALNSTSGAKKVKEPIRSIFDSYYDESPIEISSKKISVVTQISEYEEVREKCSITSSWNVDSDDEPPTEVPFKKITAVHKSPRDLKDVASPTTGNEFEVESATNRTINAGKPEETKLSRFEEEFSNSSGLSSQVFELNANIEMISQFENVRTPPKVKDLFDSTNEKNSNVDVFNILEEMKSASQSLLQKKHELIEFSRILSPPWALETVLAPPVIPSLAKYQMYSPPQRRSVDESEIKDEDDSEEETLIIAEDDQVNDNSGGGIEIDTFNCHDTNYNYAFPTYMNSLTPSNLVNDLSSNATISRDQTFTKQMPKMKIQNENQVIGRCSAIKFEFYKENVRTEKDDDAVKASSPFESIWANIKLLCVRNSVKDEKDILLPCCHSVPQFAFFYRIRQTDTKGPRVSVEQDEVVRVEKLIDRYLENVQRNEYLAVKNFKISVNSNSTAIADALTNTVLKIANRSMKELKELLGYLANLCVDLETDHLDFITEMQTSLRDQIFVENWTLDKINGSSQVTCIISMSIIFTFLSQRSNNLKSVKDLLLEALRSFKYRAHPIAFGVLNAWPAVFNDASRNCLLTRIILFSLLNHSMDRNLKLYKVIEVREMITLHYRMKLGDKTAEDYVKESMLLFDDDTWVDAIVLLCKRKLFPWSYTNVIMKYLIQIVDRWKEHDFNEMILVKTVQALHKILLSCPMRAVQGSNKVKEKSSVSPTKQLTFNINPIIETLSNVLQCRKGSRELRETVAIAICGVSHLNFELCSEILSKWDPPEGVISNKALEEMHLIMHKYRSYKPNAWLRVILPKGERPKAVPNRRNTASRKFNNNFSKQQRHQQPIREKNFTSNNGEPPLKKKKKKKKKSKKNQRNLE